MQGAPEPVTTPAQARSDLSPYLSGDVLEKFYAADATKRLGMSPRAWRDSVIAARLEVTDQNYLAFTNAMRAETSGVNLGTNLAALGLSGAAAVASGGMSQPLAAAAAGVLGAGTAFNKEVLFQKTLPVLIAQMDANRMTVLVRIRTAQQSDEMKYPLSVALTDLADYERAGALDSAIQSLTASAVAQEQVQKAQLMELTGLTVLPEAIESRKEKLSDYVAALVRDKQADTLKQIADTLGLASDDLLPNEPDSIKALGIRILQYIDVKVNGDNAETELNTISTQLNPITHQTF
jgi:hypothetical protein